MKFVTGLLDTLSGKTARDAQKAQAEQQQQSRVTQERQMSALQDEERRSRGRRAPRGRRLLLAEETGERGLASTLG